MLPFLDVRTKSLLHFCKIRRLSVFKKLILIHKIFNLVKINYRVENIILRLKFLVLFLNEMEGECRKKKKVTNS